jgi:hypothetical protein
VAERAAEGAAETVAENVAETVAGIAAVLSRRAKALRAAHAVLAVVELASLGYVWVCAATGRRDKRLGLAVALLAAEGAALVVGHGDCPLGPLQERWGDPKPLFELVLPPRAAKVAVPVLSAVAVAGVVTVAARRTPPVDYPQQASCANSS